MFLSFEHFLIVWWTVFYRFAPKKNHQIFNCTVNKGNYCHGDEARTWFYQKFCLRLRIEKSGYKSVFYYSAMMGKWITSEKRKIIQKSKGNFKNVYGTSCVEILGQYTFLDKSELVVLTIYLHLVQNFASGENKSSRK